MYKIKPGVKLVFKKSQDEVAEEIGCDRATLNRVLNGKQECSKILAYSIVKYLDSELELLEIFNEE